MKKFLFILIVSGAYIMTPPPTTARMKREEPSRTAMPISIPLNSPPDTAESDAKTSGAPPPKASSVTPAKLSDSLNVLLICCKDGLKNSSAVKLSR